MPAPDQDLTRGYAAGIARGAAVIAGLTVLSRILGLVRTLVFSQRVGASCLGTAYVTANQVPNLVYELILGGALTSAMIPVLARSAELAGTDPAQRARVSQIASALLTWSVIILLPLTLVVAVAAGPIADLLIPANGHAHCARADVVAVTGRMLAVFAPQIILSGLAVPLVLAARRIRGPEAVRGTGRAALAGTAAGVAGAVAGAGVSLIFPVSHKLLATGVAVLAAGVAVLAFGLVAYLLNDGDLRAATSWLRQVTRRVPEEVLPFLAVTVRWGS
jgi:putative peptidoglycan lipid II flippase